MRQLRHAMRLDVTLGERSFKGWDAWSMRRGPLELVLVPQVGGRIMGLLWNGVDLMFTQPEREGTVLSTDASGDVMAQKRAQGFPLWGGDKTWIAPQSRWNEATPYLDLDSGPYELEILSQSSDRAAVRMASRVCRETGLRITRTVTLAADSAEFVVRHEVENLSQQPREAEIWDVAMLLTPGVVYLPAWAQSGFPDGVKTYDAEGRSAEVRHAVVRRSGACAVVSCHGPSDFKFGVDGPEGWIAAVLERPVGRLVGYRKAVQVFMDRPYAHGCVAEVYKSAAYPYLEMELHGPLVMLDPGERFSIDERQAVSDVPAWPTTEVEIRALAQ